MTTTAEPSLSEEWLAGTSARWNGYLDFQRNPQPKLEFLAEHMT